MAFCVAMGKPGWHFLIYFLFPTNIMLCQHLDQTTSSSYLRKKKRSLSYFLHVNLHYSCFVHLLLDLSNNVIMLYLVTIKRISQQMQRKVPFFFLLPNKYIRIISYANKLTLQYSPRKYLNY